MAILVAIRSTKQSPSAMRGLINYCLQEKKTFDINSDIKLITGVNCIPQNAYTEFMTTKAVYHQERGVNFYHFSQSFSPEEKITPKEAHEVAVEFVKKAWPGHEALVCTHMDEPHLHSNIVVNSVNFENGTKLHLSPSSLKVLRDMNDDVCKSYGLSVLQPYEKGRKGMSTREFRAAEKGQSWKFRLMSDIRESMKRSGTCEEFTKEMARRGYEMKWTDERKYITFTCPNGMKCRDIKLHHDKFLKEAIENEFKIREQLTNGFQTEGINGEELEEYGRVRQQSIGTEGVFHTRETEVSGTENDTGYGRIPTGAVHANKDSGYENRDIEYVESDATESAGREPEYHEQPDSNERDYRSEDGEFVATGWEDERRIYFEILRNPEHRGNETEQSYEQVRETPVEVPGDNSRSGNLILDAGVDTLTALASLMDNDQDDDPEEKKKNLDAKEAGSNVGFALGSAIGLAAALIAKSKKQDEDITETPTEELD
ncbi:MAG: relaxase/mobilization nuclease domain-containing protein, partial [Clostridia bacterium]|nr:relaxase/mobilization nuclease domain-containing protein [Clostridia bacterium]